MSNTITSLGIGSLALLIGIAGLVLPTDFEIEDYVSYQKLLVGNIADRPLANITDRWFYAEDEGIMYYDNSTHWLAIDYTNNSTFNTHVSDYDNHFHWKNRQTWIKNNDTETSTTSTTYIRLITSSVDPAYAGAIVKIGFTHNVKNEGTIATRGATFRFGFTDALGNVTVAELRWTDGLADYKVMSVTLNKAITYVSGDYTFWVDWKVDNGAYATWSKERFLHVESFQQGGNIP